MSENLPPAVKAQLDRANAIQNKIAGQGEKPTPAAAEASQPAAEHTPPKAEAPATPEPPKQEPRKLTPRVEDPAAPSEPAGDEATWEQRYKSFKGHADAELRRAHQTVEDMRTDNAELRAEMKQMREQLDALRNKPEPEPELPQGATEEDIESFGADQVAFTQRVAAKAVADALSVVDAKISGVMGAIEEMRGTVTQVDERATMSAEALFFKDLASEVSDFKEINNSIEWREWLQGVDQMSGETRQDLLSRAQAALSVDRVAAIFNNFKRELGIGDASATSPNQNQARSDLESQVSPPKSKTTQAGSQQSEGQPKVWTQAEIASVYDRAARGRIDPEEFKALEKEINMAIRTNRVR